MKRALFYFCSIANTTDLKDSRKPLADPLHHIGDKLSRKPMDRPDGPVFVLADYRDVRAFNLDLDFVRDSLRELSPRALHVDHAVVKRNLHTRGDGDGQFSNSRHEWIPPTKSNRLTRRPSWPCALPGQRQRPGAWTEC